MEDGAEDVASDPPRIAIEHALGNATRLLARLYSIASAPLAKPSTQTSRMQIALAWDDLLAFALNCRRAVSAAGLEQAARQLKFPNEGPILRFVSKNEKPIIDRSYWECLGTIIHSRSFKPVLKSNLKFPDYFAPAWSKRKEMRLLKSFRVKADGPHAIQIPLLPLVILFEEQLLPQLQKKLREL